jgi:hypothetical protein
VILTYGDEDVLASGWINALRSFQDICGFTKANLAESVYCSSDKVGDVQTNGELLRKCMVWARLGDSQKFNVFFSFALFE